MRINTDYDTLLYFSSSELSLCSTLIALGFTLEAIDKSNPRRALFVFKRNAELDQAIDKFWKRKLHIEPLAYSEAQRYLKSRLYGE